jgi:GMP synthase-like glutamine amidotransferase
MMPDSFDVFEWHGEVFDLPDDCVPLAGSAVAPVQAFRYDTRAYGLLFHIEMERSGIEALSHHCPDDLSRANRNALAIMRQAEPHLPALHTWAAALTNHLLAP